MADKAEEVTNEVGCAASHFCDITKGTDAVLTTAAGSLMALPAGASFRYWTHRWVFVTQERLTLLSENDPCKALLLVSVDREIKACKLIVKRENVSNPPP